VGWSCNAVKSHAQLMTTGSVQTLMYALHRLSCRAIKLSQCDRNVCV
jgi:hypothetical protein